MTIPIQGKIRNVSAKFTDNYNVQINYELEQLFDNPNYQTCAIYDGIIIDRNDNAETTTDLILSASGNHSFDLKRLPKFSEPINYINYAYGNNVYLNWDNSTDSDLEKYIIKRGTTVVATITDTVVDTRYYALTTNGGQYSLSGLSPIRFNGSLTVSFTTNGFSFNGKFYDFLQAGVTFQLDYGITLTLHDDPSTYSDFDIFVGIKSDIVLANQPEGENTYSIIPVDIAGNEGTAITKTVYVNELPDNFVFDETTLTITDFGNNIDQYNVYADYLPVNQIKLQYIYEDVPVQVLDYLNPTVVDLPVGTKYYVRPVVNGIEHKNIIMYTVPDPTEIIGTLAIPADVIAKPIAGGTFTIQWTYELTDTDKADHFNIYRYNDYNDTWTIANFTTVSISNTSNIYGDVLEYSYSFNYQFGNGFEFKFKVVAVDANDVEGDFSDIASAFADADKPSISGDLYGVNI